MEPTNCSHSIPGCKYQIDSVYQLYLEDKQKTHLMQSSHYQFTNLLYLVEQFRVCLSPLLYDIGFAVAAGKAATKREWMG